MKKYGLIAFSLHGNKGAIEMYRQRIRELNLAHALSKYRMSFYYCAQSITVPSRIPLHIFQIQHQRPRHTEGCHSSKEYEK